MNTFKNIFFTSVVIISLALAAQDIVPDKRMTMEGEKWGYRNSITGEKITKAVYDEAYPFKTGFAIAKKSGKLGYVNAHGKEITPFKYDKAEDFINGFAKVQVADKLGMIDTTGKEIVEVKYMRLRNFQEGYATASLEDLGRTGFIDTKGRMSSRFYYDNAGSFSEGLVWVELRGKVGFMNKAGVEVIKPKYDFVTDFKKGYAIVMKKNLAGCVDKNGNEFIPVQYPELHRFGPDSSLILVKNQQNKFGVYTKEGKVKIPEYFFRITDFQNIGGMLLAAVYRVPGEVFFYLNTDGECYEWDGKVCPEE